jgi:hypothetical protein
MGVVLFILILLHIVAIILIATSFRDEDRRLAHYEEEINRLKNRTPSVSERDSRTPIEQYLGAPQTPSHFEDESATRELRDDFLKEFEPLDADDELLVLKKEKEKLHANFEIYVRPGYGERDLRDTKVDLINKINSTIHKLEKIKCNYENMRGKYVLANNVMHNWGDENGSPDNRLDNEIAKAEETIAELRKENEKIGELYTAAIKRR